MEGDGHVEKVIKRLVKRFPPHSTSLPQLHIWGVEGWEVGGAQLFSARSSYEAALPTFEAVT